MIPLSFVLLAWFVMMLVFVIFAILSVAIHMRFGLSGTFTTATAGIFLAVGIIVILATGIYFIQIDWSQNIGFANAPSLNNLQTTTDFGL